MRILIKISKENTKHLLDNKEEFYRVLSKELKKLKADNVHIENDKVIFRNSLFSIRSNFHPMTLIGKGYFFIDNSENIIFHYSVMRLFISWIIFTTIVFFSNLDDKRFAGIISGVAFLVILLVTIICNIYFKNIIKGLLNFSKPPARPDLQSGRLRGKSNK